MTCQRQILFASLLLGAASTAATPGLTSASTVAFPIVYSPDSRYLQDQSGAPFPILGRASWYLISRPMADIQLYVDDSVTRGYDALEMNAIDHWSGANNAPFDGNDDAPFLKRLDGGSWNGALAYPNIANEAPDYTTPNETYWAAMDALLNHAESQGVLVFLFPSYVGYNAGDQGWMQEMLANGPARMHSYGAWIANRYKDQKNLVWMLGGDMGTPPTTFNQAQTDAENALLTGIQSVARQSLYFSAEWQSESIGTDQSSFGTSMTLNSVYSWTGHVNPHARRAYAHAPAEPAFLLEEPYDEEGPDGGGTTIANPNATQPVRRFQWWGWLDAIGGYISGNGHVWPFLGNEWSSHLDTQGARDMAQLNAFVRSIAWYQLVPSGLAGMKTLVTAGGATENDAGFVAAAATPSGTLLVAYVPPAHTGTLSIDMTALGGLARARWFNPTTSAYTLIGSYSNTGVRVFTPPGDNGTGFTDWVLVIDSNDTVFANGFEAN